jgi:hypothetical protein
VQTRDRKVFVGRITKLDEEQLYVDAGGSGSMDASFTQIRELKPKELSAARKVGDIHILNRLG